MGPRGLELNSEIQTYEMSLKSELRNHYNGIVAGMADRGQSLSDGGMIERIRAYEEMNNFLSMFIERVSQYT